MESYNEMNKYISIFHTTYILVGIMITPMAWPVSPSGFICKAGCRIIKLGNQAHILAHFIFFFILHNIHGYCVHALFAQSYHYPKMLICWEYRPKYQPTDNHLNTLQVVCQESICQRKLGIDLAVPLYDYRVHFFQWSLSVPHVLRVHCSLPTVY